MAIVRESTRVVENPNGGSIYIMLETGQAMVYIEQECMVIDGTKIISEHIRKSELIGDIDDVQRMDIGIELSGNIYLKEQLSPVDNDDTSAFLLWEDGKVARTEDGKVIYQVSIYSEDPEEGDELVDRKATATH